MNCCMVDEKIIVGLTPIKIHINNPMMLSIILINALPGDNCLFISSDKSFSEASSLPFSLNKNHLGIC